MYSIITFKNRSPQVYCSIRLQPTFPDVQIINIWVSNTTNTVILYWQTSRTADGLLAFLLNMNQSQCNLRSVRSPCDNKEFIFYRRLTNLGSQWNRRLYSWLIPVWGVITGWWVDPCGCSLAGRSKGRNGKTEVTWSPDFTERAQKQPITQASRHELSYVCNLFYIHF